MDEPLPSSFDVVFSGEFVAISKLPRSARRKTDVFEVFEKADGVVIADIRWYAPWRRYALFPRSCTAWEQHCLGDIVTFLDTIKSSKKKELE